MVIERYELGDFIFNKCAETNLMQKSEAVTAFAALCGSSYSTVYKWIRDESHLVLEIKINDKVTMIEVVRMCAGFESRVKF